MRLFTVLTFCLLALSAWAGSGLLVRGQVLQLDSQIAVISADGLQTRLTLALLSEADRQLLRQELGRMSTVTLHVPLEAIVKAPTGLASRESND